VTGCLGFFAIGLSVFTLWVTFRWQDHSLVATISRPVYNSEAKQFAARITFRNTGNRSESVQAVLYSFPDGMLGSTEIDCTADHSITVTRSFSLLPGEIATRTIRQSVDVLYFLAEGRQIYKPNPESQIVGFEFIALNPENVPVSTKVIVCAFDTIPENFSSKPLPLIDPKPLVKRYGDFVTVELLKSTNVEVKRPGIYYRTVDIDEP
jgi:hypothetical protein